MSRISNAHTVSIVPQPTTALQTAVAALNAQIAGGGSRWYLFKDNDANQNANLGSQPGNSTSLIPYCNKMPWNHFNRSIEFVSQDHTGVAAIKHYRYSEDSDQFYFVSQPNFPGHGFDHNAVNPFNGDLYNKEYGGGGSIPMTTNKLPFESSTWTLTSTSPSLSSNIIYGTFWWKGAFTGGSGLGAHGGLGVYTRGTFGTATDGGIALYNPLTNTWPFASNSMSPFLIDNPTGGEYNEVAAYSEVHNVAVYGGGHGNYRRCWRMSSNGSVLEMPQTPDDTARIGIHYGNLICDPVSGNFILMSFRQIFSLNPTGSGTWTLHTGVHVPPAGVGQLPEGGGGNDFIIGVELPDHGCMAFIRQRTTGAFYLYKHA